MRKRKRKGLDPDRLASEYLKTYGVQAHVRIGFSIPDAYCYAKSIGKEINELSEAELRPFVCTEKD